MGFDAGEVEGRRSSDLFGDEAALHNEHDQRLLESEHRISYENRLSRPGREARDTIVTKVRFTHADGTPAGIVGSIIDVTEFRDAERRIREARDEAEFANNAKSEFIANISHELRTPLQAILGFADLGADLSADMPEFLDMFNDIQAGGQRMLTLVNGLLDVSLMDGSAASLSLHRCDVSALIQEVVEQMEPKAARREQRLQWRGPNQGATADVDAARFQQAARNVLTNAIRFSPTGGLIEILCEDLEQAGIVLTVRDHGPGIPEAELESIFDAFVQSTRTRDGSGGTGLGLTISRKIMSAHGGSIEASNAASGGALIRLWLPARGRTPGPQVAQSPENEGTPESATRELI
jgi:signal transduction histidine kinase